MRNKLTVFESRNQLLEQEKSDLTETVNMLRGASKSENHGKSDQAQSHVVLDVARQMLELLDI